MPSQRAGIEMKGTHMILFLIQRVFRRPRKIRRFVQFQSKWPANQDHSIQPTTITIRSWVISTMTSKNVVRLLFMMSLTTVGSGQSSGGENVTDAASSGITCGLNTELDESTNQCYCSAIEDRPEDPSRIYIAGLMDENAFPWCRDLFEFTVEQINLGRWGALNQSESQTLEYSFRNTECSEFMVLKEYWDLRGLNGNKPMDGVVGERCSDASITLGRICGKSPT